MKLKLLILFFIISAFIGLSACAKKPAFLATAERDPLLTNPRIIFCDLTKNKVINASHQKKRVKKIKYKTNRPFNLNK